MIWRRRSAAVGPSVHFWAGLLVGCAGLLWGCAGAKAAPELAAVDADLGLGDVVMMTWTTREAAGLLGHALSAGALGVDPHRRAMSGAEHFVPTDQTISIVVSRDHTASLGAKYGPVGGEAAGAATTHIAYEVRITGYLELGPADLRYRAESGCCAGGGLSGSCGDYYVMRMMRGSGKAEYLQKLEGSVSVTAADVVHASGGTAFRKLSTSHFEDTYFAYELAPLDGVCALLTPEEEMVPMKVAAPDNCFLTAYQENGTRVAEGWHLPDARLCWTVAERHARSIAALLDFNVRFSLGEGARLLSAADGVRAPDAAPGDGTLTPPVGAAAEGEVIASAPTTAPPRGSSAASAASAEPALVAARAPTGHAPGGAKTTGGSPPATGGAPSTKGPEPPSTSASATTRAKGQTTAR